jgi:hypothetical protein
MRVVYVAPIPSRDPGMGTFVFAFEFALEFVAAAGFCFFWAGSFDLAFP